MWVATASCTLPENAGPKIRESVGAPPISPERRAYTVKTGTTNLAPPEEPPLPAYLAIAATPDPVPGVLLLADAETSRSADVEAEARRLASGGYAVLVVPLPTQADPRERSQAWGVYLQRAVLVLQEGGETQGRSLAVVGYGEGAARALQLTLLEPAVVAAVAWGPPPVSLTGRLPEHRVSWLVLNAPPPFLTPDFKDWVALSGSDVRVEPAPEGSSPSEGFPGTPSAYSPASDRLRLLLHGFLAETVGSADEPSLREVLDQPREISESPAKE